MQVICGEHVEKMSLESPRKMQDVQEVMSETSGYATRGREEDAWKRIRWNPELFRTEWKASAWTPMVKVTMESDKFQKAKLPEGKAKRQSIRQRPMFWCDNKCSDKALSFLQFASVVIKEGEKSDTVKLCKQCYNKSLGAKRDKPLTKWQWYEFT